MKKQETQPDIMLIDGFAAVNEHSYRWDFVEKCFEKHEDLRGLWCQAYPCNGLEKFLENGYTLAATPPGILGECTVVMTREKFNYLKGRKNG